MGSYDVIDVKRQQVLGNLAGSARQAVSTNSVAWSPDGRQVAIGSVLPQTGGDRYLIQVWDVPQVSR
jgi:hypothetical protein